MKNMQLSPCYRLPLLAGVLLLAWGSPQAQEIDPLWQVINDSPTQVIPLYLGQGSPFASAEIKMNKDQGNISAEEMREVERAKQAAELKKDIQALMAGPLALLPDVSNLMAQAYIKGAHGDMALIGGRWYAEKTLFAVPTYKNPSILSKINTLEPLDFDAATEVNTALYARP